MQNVKIVKKKKKKKKKNDCKNIGLSSLIPSVWVAPI